VKKLKQKIKMKRKQFQRKSLFNAPLSNINENINFNNNFVSNTNTSTIYKLLTPTNNSINFNNTFSNNNIANNSHQINNNLNTREAQNEKINYITNLKNFCNFSSNKTMEVLLVKMIIIIP